MSASDNRSPPERPLPPEIEELRRAEQSLPEPAREVEGDVLERLRRTLELPAATPGDERATSDATIDDSAPGVSDAGLSMAGVARARTVVTLLVGAAIGAGVHEGVDRVRERRPHPAPVATERRAATARPGDATGPLPTQPTSPSLPAPPAEPVPAVQRTPPRAPATRRPADSMLAAEASPRGLARDRDLGTERALIEQARTALSRGQAGPALEALSRHERRFPRGALAEERESLRVQALVRLERYDEARDVGARFNARFPASIFAPVVGEALLSIP